MAYNTEVIADAPLAYWRLGEASGTTVNDASGNSRNGTYSAVSPTLGVAGLVAGDTAIQVAENSGQYATVASNAWMDVTNLTIECWVAVTSAVDGTNGDALVSRYTAAGGFNWVLWRNTSGRWAIQLRNNVGTVYDVQDVAVASSAKTYLAATFDGTTLRLYVNGSEVANTAVSGTVQTGTSPIEIARYSLADTTTPAMTIDEVAVYGSALSSGRISTHYTAGLTEARVAGEYVQAMILPTTTERQVAGTYSQVIIMPDVTERQLGTLYTQVLIRNPLPFRGWGMPVK